MEGSRCRAGNEQDDSGTSCHTREQGSCERLMGPGGRGPRAMPVWCSRARAGWRAGRTDKSALQQMSYGLCFGPWCAPMLPVSHSRGLHGLGRALPPGMVHQEKGSPGCGGAEEHLRVRAGSQAG